MADLAIPSFEIHGFRGFDDLRIERFGRVNLIVGKNNVGKTSLLEAIQLYSAAGNPGVIWKMLGARDAMSLDSPTPNADTANERLLALSHLFFRAWNQSLDQRTIRLGPVGDVGAELSITFRRASIQDMGPYWQQFYAYLSAYVRGAPEPSSAELGTEQLIVQDQRPILEVTTGSGERFRYDLEFVRPLTLFDGKQEKISCNFVSAQGLSSEEIAEYWDRAVLANDDSAVLDALGILAPGVEKLSLIASVRSRTQDRVPFVRVKGFDQWLPLRSLGDGMQRMLSLALALANTREGVLLIDEIENGLHYLILAQMWKLIFETARRLNVQVFATTHSWDCIKAFQQAADDDTKSEGLLIRLELKQDKIVPVLISEEDLRIVTQEEIEVR